MTFKRGKSGNPQGRPKGIISRRGQLSKLLEPHAEALINKAVELAKAGDINALRLCLERLIPKPREEAISLDMPDDAVDKPSVLLAFSTQVINAVTAGEITPDQAQKLFSVINIQGEVIALADLEGRLKALEKFYKERTKK